MTTAKKTLRRTGSFIQGESMKKVTDALQGLMDAASVNSLDKVKVQALLQSQSGDGDMDLALALQPGGAPDPAAYIGCFICYHDIARSAALIVTLASL